MIRAVLRVARIGMIAALLAVPFTPPQTSKDIKGEQAVSGIYPEVRLRKLHLVRPDLIPYPLFFEVCC